MGTIVNNDESKCRFWNKMSVAIGKANSTMQRQKSVTMEKHTQIYLHILEHIIHLRKVSKIIST